MNIEELCNDLSVCFLETNALVTASTFSGIIDWTLHQLKAKGLLMVWNYDMSAAPINQDIRLLIDDGSGGKEDVNGYINKHRTIWRYWYKSEEDYGSSTTQNAIAWMPLPKGDA